MYQGFSLLTANPYVVRNPQVGTMSRQVHAHPEQIIFKFAIQVGMVPLTGTTSLQHMKEDLTVYGFELTADEVDFIESIEG